VELGLGAEEGGVGDARALEVGLGLLRHVARVAGVGLAGERVVDEEVDDERLAGAERVQLRVVGVREQEHVRLVDLLEAADRGAVEAEAVVEHVLRERADRHGEVLHHARQVAEADVDHLDALLLDVLQDLVGTGEQGRPPGVGTRRWPCRVVALRRG
jgi:hypothetical protein